MTRCFRNFHGDRGQPELMLPNQEPFLQFNKRPIPPEVRVRIDIKSIL